MTRPLTAFGGHPSREMELLGLEPNELEGLAVIMALESLTYDAVGFVGEGITVKETARIYDGQVRFAHLVKKGFLQEAGRKRVDPTKPQSSKLYVTTLKAWRHLGVEHPYERLKRERAHPMQEAI